MYYSRLNFAIIAMNIQGIFLLLDCTNYWMYYSCPHARCFVKFCFAMKQIRYLHVTYTLAQVTQILRSSMTGENFRHQSIIQQQVQKIILPYLSECVMLSGGGENKVRLALGERESSESTKKECYENRFFGIRDLWPGVGISKQHGGKIPDRKYAREAGAENTPPSQTKKNTIVRGYQCKDFENFPTEVKKILRKKAQWPLLLVAASPTWAIFKVKYSYILNDRVFLFSAKTYRILWTRCLLLSMVCN